MNEGLLRAVVYLSAAVICVPIASRLKLGSVLGYLAAGCIIGPWGLKLGGDVHEVLHFAELGVVLMLFTIGLELDPARLWTMRRAVFGGGSLQMAACGAVLALAAIVLGLPWQGALVAGLALALSSTAIAVQSMREQNLMGTTMGRSAFGVLLFQDIAAIPLIALVPLLAGEGGSSVTVAGVARVLGAIALVVVAGRYLTRPLMRAVAKTGIREVFTVTALLLVIGTALVMTLAGLSMALGAFLAGVLLAGSEYRHALEADIEPFKGLLLGLFFMAVGMTVDFGFLASRPLEIAGLVIGLVALKAVVLRLLSPAFGIPRQHGWLFGALLSQGGEFAFVVFGVARQARLLPGEWDSKLTLAVALSMAMTPLLLLLNERLSANRQRSEHETDAVEDEGASVIIAGFGRFGQIVGRLLFASGIKATVLERDPDAIETLRRFGFRLFYGDATRLDLLEAAGASRAKLLVVAIDDMAASLDLVDVVREHFPNLRLLVRARNVTHYLELRNRGVATLERETFESALRAGRTALEMLGHEPYEARELADGFRRHNVTMLETLVPHLADPSHRVNLAKAAREQLEEQFARDRARLEQTHDDW